MGPWGAQVTTEEDFLLLSEAAFGALKEAPGASLLLLDALERLRKREPEAEPPKGGPGGGVWVDVRGFSWIFVGFAMFCADFRGFSHWFGLRLGRSSPLFGRVSKDLLVGESRATAPWRCRCMALLG